jgi:leader peptidase (prepilin peptidase)/N-methyltransferase
MVSDIAVASAVIVGLFGLLIGSFLNVVIWRLPRGESLAHPASHCPKCDAPLRWYDNIPLLSWVVLRGKCRSCAEQISIRYPAVELATGIFFAGVTFWAISTSPTGWLDHGAPWTGWLSVFLALFAFLYFAAVSVALALIDLDTQKLPNAIVLPTYVVAGALLGISALIVGDLQALLGAVVGMVGLYTAYLILALVYPGGMGFGDVKLAGVIGLYVGWLGWGELAVGAFAAFVFGGIFAVALMLAGRAGKKTAIPFGPWMLVGCWVGIFIGGDIFAWYLGLFGVS